MNPNQQIDTLLEQRECLAGMTKKPCVYHKLGHDFEFVPVDRIVNRCDYMAGYRWYINHPAFANSVLRKCDTKSDACKVIDRWLKAKGVTA